MRRVQPRILIFPLITTLATLGILLLNWRIPHGIRPRTDKYYNQTNITITEEEAEKVVGKPRVEMFINFAVAAHKVSRRDMLRQTWLSTVKHYSVAYRFFTDGIGMSPEMQYNISKEQEKHGDVVVLPTKKGYWFSHRYLYAMFWGYENYNFSFYLRMDDDYFVCLNNLYNDLQYRKHEKHLYWGHMYCFERRVGIDEGFLIISVDLVEEIIKRNDTLYCHPMGDQMIAMWLRRIENETGLNVTYFKDNSRLMHYRKQLQREHSDMCKNIIGIHEAYPAQLQRYWNLTKSNWYSIKPNEFRKIERKPYHEYCDKPRGWDWRVHNDFWRHEPKPCWDPNVDWPELKAHKQHKGRE